MGLAIDIAVECDAWLALGELDRLASRAAEAALRQADEIPADGTELSVVLCDDDFIRDLNARWRGKDKATNVLSFPTAGPDRDTALGDIVVAWETCAREAAEQGCAPADYLAHLLVHGIFHLLGHDHQTGDEAEAMEAAEARALASLGIASPYDDPRGPASSTDGDAVETTRHSS